MRAILFILIVTLIGLHTPNAFGDGIDFKLDIPRVEMGDSSDMIAAVTRHLEAVIVGESKPMHAQFALGAFYYLQGRSEQAKQQWEACLTSTAGHSDCSFYLGLLIFQKQDKKQFVQSMEKTITLNPKYVWAYNRLGDFYEKEGAFEKADGVWTLAKTRMPEEESFYFNQASMHWVQWSKSRKRKELLESVVVNLTKATALRPRAKSFVLLGLAYMYTGKFVEARNALQKAEEMDPKDVSTLIVLANAYKATEEFPQAISTLEKALALMPTNEDIKADLKELKEYVRSNPAQ